jgi:hypothetical protein
MSKQQEPKKPKQPRAKKLKLNKKEQWQSILKEIDRGSAPVSCLEHIQVLLKDGTIVVVDVKQLLEEGLSPDEIEYLISAKLKALDHIVEDVDFFVSLDKVASTVQPLTDNILKDL